MPARNDFASPERVQLADALSRYMQQLGLKRRAKATQSLGDLLAKGVQDRA
jgi:hypothetical protein